MRNYLLLGALLLLSACGSAPPAPPVSGFQDQLFQKTGKIVSPQEIMHVSDDMHRFIEEKVRHNKKTDIRYALYDAIRFNELKLEYDAEKTKTASEAFNSKSGNCLSLVLMTAAMAHELGMTVHFQNVLSDESWSRLGTLQFAAGHVNILLGHKVNPYSASYRDLQDPNNYLIVDFLPAEDTVKLRTEEIPEKRILAMYYNNRAVELMADKKNDEAYWHIKAAIELDPGFMPARNTLGVIYRQHGNLEAAQLAFEQLLQSTPDNTITLSNLRDTLNAEGKHDDALRVQTRLNRLQPYPPFYFLTKAQQAIQAGDLQNAKKWLNEELERVPYNDEIHFWMAIACFKSGDYVSARREMALAREYSTRKSSQQLYSQKLRLLSEHGD